MPNRTVFVTGASRGVGLEFVRQLLARGDSVIAAARDIRSPGLVPLTTSGQLTLVELDVSDPASIEGLPGRLGERGVDVLINNAGVSSTQKSVAHLDASDMQRVFMVNAIAPLLVTRAMLPALRRGGGRTIVQITSQLGSIANNTGGSTYAYRGSKAALNQLNRSLSSELGPQGFVCVAIHPGWVRTDMGGPSAHLSPEESVASMLKVIDTLSPGKSGAFLNYDGTGLPW
ncbi:MAG: SDR family oxidoreductase [Phycisphaerales bacterium]|nr:SDR family oxidoreductase [Phycisphaerales bacterium]